MDNHFWDSVRSEIHKNSRMSSTASNQFPTPYSHPYARQVQWNFHTAQLNNDHVMTPSLMQAVSSEQDMAGGSAVSSNDMKQTFQSLIEDVETLRRVITQQQQILEALRHQQGVVSNDAARHESVIAELTTARPARDAWVAQADASIRATAQQCSSLHNRLEQLAITCHERPSREELNGAIKAAISSVSTKLESISSVVQDREASSTSTGHTPVRGEVDSSPVDHDTIKSIVIEVLSSMKKELKDAGNNQIAAVELEEAKMALSGAKQQLEVFMQESQTLGKNNTSTVNSYHDTDAMEDYWTKIQSFVTRKLTEFESRMHRGVSSPIGHPSEDRLKHLEKTVSATSSALSQLAAQVDQDRKLQSSTLTTALVDMRREMVSEVKIAISDSEIKTTKELASLVESTTSKESNRWERKLDEALDAVVSKCRSACNADAKYNIERALSTADTAVERMVEGSRSEIESTFSEAERRLKASLNESRELLSKNARRANELEERVDQVERTVRGDLRKLREDVRDMGVDVDSSRRFTQTQYQPQPSQGSLDSAVSTLLSAMTLRSSQSTGGNMSQSTPTHWTQQSHQSTFNSPVDTRAVYDDTASNRIDTSAINPEHSSAHPARQNIDTTLQQQSQPKHSSFNQSPQVKSKAESSDSSSGGTIPFPRMDTDVQSTSFVPSPKSNKLRPVKTVKPVVASPPNLTELKKSALKASRSPSPEPDRERRLSSISIPESEISETSGAPSSPASFPTRRRRRSFSVAHIDEDIPTSPTPTPATLMGRRRSEPPFPRPEVLQSLQAEDEDDDDEEESGSTNHDKLRSSRVPKSKTLGKVGADLEESGDSIDAQASSDSVMSGRRSRSFNNGSHAQVRTIFQAPRLNSPKVDSQSNLPFNIDDAAGPEGPPPPLAETRPSQLVQPQADTPPTSGHTSPAQTLTSSHAQSVSSPQAIASQSTEDDSKGMSAEKALSIRGSPVPSTCEFNVNDPLDMQLRSEGWSKHSGKNGNPFWAAIGDAKLSTWSRPVPGELAAKKKQHAAVKSAADDCLNTGAITQAEVDSVWALILNKNRTPEAVVREWRGKEAAHKKKLSEAKSVPKVQPVAEFRPRESNLLTAGLGDRHARERLALTDDDDGSSSDSGSSASSSASTIASTQSSNQASTVVTSPFSNAPTRTSTFSAFTANKKTGAIDFATKALSWNKEELAAHLRTKGLTPIANKFEAEVIDSKTLALMETGDLTSPPPVGFGLSEEDPMFQALWSFKLQLKAALDRAEMREKFQKQANGANM